MSACIDRLKMYNNHFETLPFSNGEERDYVNVLKPYFEDESVEMHVAIICTSSKDFISNEELAEFLQFFSGHSFKIIDCDHLDTINDYGCAVIHADDIVEMIAEINRYLCMVSGAPTEIKNDMQNIIDELKATASFARRFGQYKYYSIEAAKQIQEKWNSIHSSSQDKALGIRFLAFISESEFETFSDSESYFPNHLKYAIKVPSFSSLFERYLQVSEQLSSVGEDTEEKRVKWLLDLLQEGKQILADFNSGKITRDEVFERLIDDKWKVVFSIGEISYNMILLSLNVTNKQIEDKEKKNNIDDMERL